jgi:toxin FitB
MLFEYLPASDGVITALSVDLATGRLAWCLQGILQVFEVVGAPGQRASPIAQGRSEGRTKERPAAQCRAVSFLLDTNVVSECVRPRPDPGVVSWLAEADEDRVFISVITLAELRYGIERMAAGQRRRRLDEWLRAELPLRFEGRVLPIDATIADAWGRLTALRETSGRPIGAADAFIAATAEARDLTLVTRNVSDFERTVKAVINPWTDV